ncbi:MAG: hypothetical protein WKF30_05800 [Pyrinomonadaceae bacterium]
MIAGSQRKTPFAAPEIILPVLRLQTHGGVELFLYQNDSPRAALWMGCVLILDRW